ncbi:UNVERIFIED_CONTAM: putative late blight resistance proteinR1A-10 [Sesamum radiatum]|uniref:Late blight resistance proteinR1A-10 n=1 Tax=Sesamum radiatum TaxID=300843 RepID=A0AAW2RYH6_SESRA
MGYVALVSLGLTIERILIASRLPFLPPSKEIIQLVKKGVESIDCLLRTLSAVDSDDDGQKSGAVIKEIIEATRGLEETITESQSYRWDFESDKQVIISAMGVVKEIKETLSNTSFWPQQVKDEPLRVAVQYAFHAVRTLERVFTAEDNSNSEGVKAVKAEIREAAFRLEDVLESAHVSDQHFLSQSQTSDGDDHMSDLAIKVGNETFFFIETATKILDNLLQQPEDDNAALVLSRTDHIEAKAAKIFGLDHELVRLKDRLLKKARHSLHVTTIVGMAGIGKTTLAKEIYEDPDIVSHFECRAFVSIGPEYALREIKLSILAQTNPEVDEIHVQDEELLDSELLLRLRSRRYLIVLDDIWDKDIWDLTWWVSPIKCDGSRIIITTRLEDCILPAEGFLLRKRFLNQQESWLLFCDKVFGGDHSSCPPELEKAGRKIVKKCEGLPLTIIAVARHLRDAEKTPEYWKQAKRKIYTTIISEDNATSQVREHSLSGGIKTCNIYPVFWHICMREAGEQKFFHVIDSNGNQGIESQRRHCIHNNVLFGIKDVRESMTSIPNVRSILCTGPHHQYPVPICLDFRLLRVLDALTIRFYGFPSEVVKLVRLRYLAFTYNGKLPASISKLCNLEYLIVRQYLSILSSGERRPYLPKEIWDMQGLRHLQVMGSDLHDPSYEGAILPNLSTLSALDVDEPLCCFGNLALLHKLESLKWSIVNPHLQVAFSTLSFPIFPPSLKKLTLLGLRLPWEMMIITANLRNLEVLKLQCYAFQGPVWKMDDEKFSWPKLRYLLIEDSDLEEWYVSGSFDSLKRLILRHCYKLKEIPQQIVCIEHVGIELEDCNNPSLLASIKHWAKKRVGSRKLQVCNKFSADDRKLKS